MDDLGKVMTVNEVAERLAVHPETVKRWLRAGLLEGTKLPTGRWGRGEWRVSERDLTRFLEGGANDK